MSRHLILLGLLLSLAACQAPRPIVDYDAGRDFSAYRTWSWQEPAIRYRPEDPRLQSDLTDQRLRDALAEALDQRGLRPAPAGSKGDLTVQAWLIVDNHQQQVVTQYPSPWVHPRHRSLFWGAGFYEAQTVNYQQATLQVDLHDGGDGKLVWRGSSDWVVARDPGQPAERATLYRDHARQALSGYPPR